MAEVLVGMRAMDVITGFEGIVVGITKWLTGGATVGIQPMSRADGIKRSIEWFNVNRIQITGPGVTVDFGIASNLNPGEIPEKGE